MKAELFISFPDQSESFVNGYEAGIVGTKMYLGIESFQMNIHKENEALIREMAGKYGYNLAVQHYEGYEEWKFLVAFKKTSMEN